jgi:hypothetical protein
MSSPKRACEPNENGLVWYVFCARADDLEAALRALSTKLPGVVGRYTNDWPDFAIARAVCAEQERCAKIAEEYTYPDPEWGTEQITDDHLQAVAARIRENPILPDRE